MSFHLIIVDDEEAALRGLAEYINWDAIGYALSGTAHTIGEAMDLIEHEPVDVVLTDIQLEDESGLDLVGRLSKEYPRIRCVILSGHGEFEYARQAIRYGTFDFLTKPVQFDALRRTFTQLAQRLQQDSQDIGMKKEYTELKRARFFNNLAKEVHTSFDPAVALDLGIQTTGSLSLVRFRFETAGPRTVRLEGAKHKLRAAMEEQFDPAAHYEMFNNALNEYAVLFYNCSETAIESMLTQLEKAFPLPVSIGVSRVFHSLADLSPAYFEAGKALDYCLLRKNSSIVFYAAIQDVLYKRNIISDELALELNKAFAQKDIHELLTITQREMDRLNRGRDSINYLYSFCVELQLLADHFLRSYLPGYTGQDIAEATRQIVLRDSAEALCEYNRAYILSLEKSIQQATPYVSDTVQSIQRYIQEHYAEDISLQALANQFFLHPNYLSQLFTEKTGRNFIDYLTQVRMEKAQGLLRDTGLRVYDISQMVGYESPKYFSKVFKEVTGCTPKEYRDRQK